jgi:hypothetical protein
MADARIRRVLVAVSLANVSLLRVWNELLTFTRSDAYLMKLPPSPAQFAGAAGALLVLAAVYFVLLEFALRRRIGAMLFCASLALPANAFREVLSQHFPLLRGQLFRVVQPQVLPFVAAIVGICGLVAILRYHARLVAAVSAVALILSPFAALTLARAAWAAVRYDDSNYRDKPLAARLPKREAPPRVVWIIFDEMDQHIAFDRHDVDLPEFTRFRDSALYATRAFPPGSATLTSIPALLVGKLVTDARQVSPQELRLFYSPREHAGGWVTWKDQESILSFARKEGFNTAVIGWFHPYCRILNGDVTHCWWEAMPFQADSVSRSFPRSTVDYLRSLFETSLLSPFGQSLTVKQGAERLQSLVSAGARAAADETYGFVFLHVQTPHSPHTYNRRTGQFTLRNAPVSGYLDSLALADLTLGRIRKAMEASGMWEKSAVLLSSDHWYRTSRTLIGAPSSRRIPFLLKLPGPNVKGIVYPHELHTVHSANLLKAVLQGEIQTLDAAAQWLHRARSPSVYSSAAQ